MASSVCFARDLENRPGNIATPTHLAENAKDISRDSDVKVTVFDRKEFTDMGMGALAIGALALLPALPVLLALAGIGMLGMALAGGGESDVAESEPMAVTDMSVTEEKLDGVISAVHALEATNRELLTTMNRGIKGLAEV